jgi:ribonuclease HI
MRVFTDGACTHNGRPNAAAGYAVWFPDHRELSEAARIQPPQPQTNQRAELTAISRAVTILDEKGFHDTDLVIYTDSEYCVNCLTKWIPGWVARKWKTSAGGDVLHRDLIEATFTRLAKFRSHRFVHVRAHTGKEDDLSKNNDVVDRMARGTLETAPPPPPPAQDVLFEGCPLQLMGSPVPQSQVVAWVRAHLDALPADVVNKHLFKAFTEACKDRDVSLVKQTIQRTPMIRAECSSLQVSREENTV